MTPLRDGGGFVSVARDPTDRKRMEDELRDARDRLEIRVVERSAELERALDSLATAQEHEQRRVSRDLHDSIGQLLAGLSLTFKAIETSCEPAAPAPRGGQRVMGVLGREVHGLAVRLRPTSLDDIGLAALEQRTCSWAARIPPMPALTCAGLFCRIPFGAIASTRRSPESLFMLSHSRVWHHNDHSEPTASSACLERPAQRILPALPGRRNRRNPQNRHRLCGLHPTRRRQYPRSLPSDPAPGVHDDQVIRQR